MTGVKNLNSIQIWIFQQFCVNAISLKKIVHWGGVNCLSFHTIVLFKKILCSWTHHRNSRNAFLVHFQERTPGQGFGINFGTLLKCWGLRLWIQYECTLLRQLLLEGGECENDCLKSICSSQWCWNLHLH